MIASRLVAAALGGAVVVALALPARPAHADLRPHGKLGVAHAVGSPQSSEFGLGVTGGGAVELGLGEYLGAQVGLGGLVLAAGDRPSDPRFLPQSTGTAFTATLGLRLHALGASRGGLWLDANGGLGQTGDLSRLALEGDVGWDFKAGDRLQVGPYFGYLQVVQPDSDRRPNDARVLSLGVHVGFGPPPKVRADRDGDTVFDDEDACPDEPGVRTQDPTTNGCPKRDRDRDGILDEVDACPDEPGVPSEDPKKHGCPRRDKDGDTVFDDEDACVDVPGVRTTDPKTNGCPPPDRDNDGVPDADDNCPDVPGEKTDDPKTNGCPKSDGPVRMEGDRIVLDDVILFDLDSPRVRHVSWGLVAKVAQFINGNPDVLEVSIEGHADATGTVEHNQYLSKERAESVRRLLIKSGVDEKRVKAEGFGRSRLKVQTRKAEQANRRVEFWVTRARAAGAKDDGRAVGTEAKDDQDPNGGRDDAAPPVKMNEKAPGPSPKAPAGGSKP